MKKIYPTLILYLLLFILAGCGVANRAAIPSPAATAPEVERSNPSSAMSVMKFEEIETSLRQAYNHWKGTPYVWGGNSVSGVDCSAFMQIIFDQYFGMDLPRNTRRQLYMGHEVNRNRLKSGDLIFFKTGRKTLHVGVIIQGNNFLHASTSQGVTISSVNDYYWRSRFMAAKRVMNNH